VQHDSRTLDQGRRLPRGALGREQRVLGEGPLREQPRRVVQRAAAEADQPLGVDPGELVARQGVGVASRPR